MSDWTHINGVFRIDNDGEKHNRKYFNKIFGKQCLFTDSIKRHIKLNKHPEKFLPSGSEGTCQLHIIKNVNPNDIIAYDAVITGDLRNCSYTKEIVNYFIKVCRKFKLGTIRQAVLTTSNDCFGYTETVTVVDNTIKTVTYDRYGTRIAETTQVLLIDEIPTVIINGNEKAYKIYKNASSAIYVVINKTNDGWKYSLSYDNCAITDHGTNNKSTIEEVLGDIIDEVTLN